MSPDLTFDSATPPQPDLLASENRVKVGGGRLICIIEIFYPPLQFGLCTALQSHFDNIVSFNCSAAGPGIFVFLTCGNEIAQT